MIKGYVLIKILSFLHDFIKCIQLAMLEKVGIPYILKGALHCLARFEIFVADLSCYMIENFEQSVKSDWIIKHL